VRAMEHLLGPDAAATPSLAGVMSPVAAVMFPVYGLGLKSGCTLLEYIQISD